ncbi:manganese/iron transport system ATP-binding protein [Micromonospora viridifaciens]|uniref:Manganese/iron transport system ATP-binding protein n=1 Tax=Micromonospora viridifaciens TaxID=1881 RepID=A0A1C4WJF3_MICVI|nr:ATP-binding cassette domain-containing protein [Micromonospora viridifaciens]SCE96342.1 manganese/iron transport system ATP-binding protein [Micromonospora viridifaciens]
MAEPTRTPVADAALHLAQADVGYRRRAVLTNVNLTVAPGQIVALVGANGAGKSTLIKAVVGLADILAGTITVAGRAARHARGAAAYVPQVDTLDADFPVTAADVVLMGRYQPTRWLRQIRPTDRAVAADALERVGLADRARTRFGLLSGGQRQRVLLARAIAAQARLMLMDEPFNGLDVTSQDVIVTQLRDLAATGTAVLLSTHDLRLARDLADTACLIHGGRAVTGPTEQILAELPSTYGYGSQAADLHAARPGR